METTENAENWRCFPAADEAYERIRDFVMDAAEAAGVPLKMRMKLELGLEEVIVNIIRHAYEEPGEIWLSARPAGERRFAVDVADFGVPFNPLAQKAKTVEPDKPLAEQEPGGLGIFFIKKLFTGLSYEYGPWRGKPANRLHMEFTWEPDQ